MENLLQFLPTGIVSLAVGGLILIVLMAAGIYQIGIEGLKVLLNSSHESAPEFNWQNKIWTLLMVCLPTRSRVEKIGGQWRVSSILGGYIDLEDGSTRTTKSAYYIDCLTSNYDAVKKYEGKGLDGIQLIKYLFFVVATDTILSLVSQYFFPTVIFSSIVLVVFGIRTLAGKVYTNTSKITGHEERIDVLENKGEK